MLPLMYECVSLPDFELQSKPALARLVPLVTLTAPALFHPIDGVHETHDLRSLSGTH
jgi:hypothetical protein